MQIRIRICKSCYRILEEFTTLKRPENNWQLAVIYLNKSEEFTGIVGFEVPLISRTVLTSQPIERRTGQSVRKN